MSNRRLLPQGGSAGYGEIIDRTQATVKVSWRGGDYRWNPSRWQGIMGKKRSKASWGGEEELAGLDL